VHARPRYAVLPKRLKGAQRQSLKLTGWQLLSAGFHN
jgi:hypothetical protein